MIKIPNLDNIKAVSIPLRDFNKEVYKLIGQDAERVGITTQQLIVLFEVANNPLGGLEQLSETMQLSASTLSGIVDRLVKTELLVRERSERDRRHLELRISPAGVERVREAFNPDTSVFLQRMSFALQLPEEDLQTMMRVQRQMLARLRGEDETSPSK